MDITGGLVQSDSCAVTPGKKYLHHEIVRRATFNGWPKEDIVSHKALAEAGLMFLGDVDKV